MKDEIVLYQPNATIQLEVHLKDETIWLNRNQMAVLFDRDVKTIDKHINNALREELAPTAAKNATTQEQNQVVANCDTLRTWFSQWTNTNHLNKNKNNKIINNIY